MAPGVLAVDNRATRPRGSLNAGVSAFGATRPLPIAPTKVRLPNRLLTLDLWAGLLFLLRVFGRLPVTNSATRSRAGVRKASGEETARGVCAGGGVGLWGFSADVGPDAPVWNRGATPLPPRHTRTRASRFAEDGQCMGKRAQWVGTAVYREKRLRPLRDTRAHAREAGTTYGNNQVVERAARRLRRASETAPNFAFFRERRAKRPGRPRQAYRDSEIGALGGSN